MLKKEGKINDAIIENMLSRRHTGFHVHIGARIWPESLPLQFDVRVSRIPTGKVGTFSARLQWEYST